jgi:hypothetical protein
MRVIATNEAAGLHLEYAVQPADWLARIMAGTGLIAIVAFGSKLGRRKQVIMSDNASLRGKA